MFSSVVMIITSFIFFSYENVIVRTDDKKELPSAVALCLLLSVSVIALTFIVFLTGGVLSISFFATFPSIILLVVALLSNTLNTLFSNISNRYALYTAMSLAGIIAGASQALFRLLFGVFHIESGLIYGNILSVLLSVSFYFYQTRKILKYDIVIPVRISEIKQVALKYKRFPLFDAPARMIEYVIGNVVIIILSLFFDLKEIGCFSMIATLVQIPLTLMGTSMSTVYFKDLSDISNDKDKVKELTRRTARICFIMSFLPCLFLVLGGDYLLVLFLGGKWTLAGSMSLCLAIFSIPVILSEPLIPLFKVLNRQDLRFWLNIANLVAIIISIYGGIFLSHNILITLILYSASYALLRFVMFGYQLRLVGLSFWDFKKEMVVIVLLYVALFIRLFFVLA